MNSNVWYENAISNGTRAAAAKVGGYTTTMCQIILRIFVTIHQNRITLSQS